MLKSHSVEGQAGTMPILVNQLIKMTQYTAAEDLVTDPRAGARALESEHRNAGADVPSGRVHFTGCVT